MAPVHALRAVFALSVFACAVILVLFVRGRVTWTDGFWLQLFAAALGVSLVICAVAFRKGRLRLAGVSWGQLAHTFFMQLMWVYIASAVGIGLVALAVIYAITASAASSVALAVLSGLWLALWFAPGVASLTSWHKLRALRTASA
ncbi:MAG: hypothetical protein K2W33_20235 [Burkholderiales bacterium]|nr:hypothetical protein [Burkholderiales bacterium]